MSDLPIVDESKQSEIREFLRIYRRWERSEQIKDILWNVGTIAVMIGGAYLAYQFLSGEELYPEDVGLTPEEGDETEMVTRERVNEDTGEVEVETVERKKTKSWSLSETIKSFGLHSVKALSNAFRLKFSL